MRFESDVVLVGEFRLPPDSPLWREPNSIGAGHHIVFPSSAVRIAQGDRPAFVADRNRVVLYNPGQEYRRALVSSAGDDCCYLIVRPDVVEEVVHATSFPTDQGPLRPAAFLTQRRLHRLVRRAPRDAMQIEELALSVVARALHDAVPPAGQPPPSAVDRAWADDVTALLNERFAEPLTLSDVGSAIGCSPYHLARAFRRGAGSSIHAYRRQLRVRYALDHVLDGCDDLAGLAARAGFASHSHLTDTFRSTFGLPPSRAREIAGTG